MNKNYNNTTRYDPLNVNPGPKYEDSYNRNNYPKNREPYRNRESYSKTYSRNRETLSRSRNF